MIEIFLTALQTIIFYILVIVPAEYYLTESSRTLKYLGSGTKTLIFIPIFLLVFIFNYFVIKNSKSWLLISIVFFLSLFGFYKYRQYYSYLQQFPRIYSLSSDWSIQAKKIVIDGKNFGSINDESYVRAGGIDFMIDQWTNEKIVASQPMSTEYGETYLYVYRADNQKRSNKILFELRDPAEL